MQKARTCCNGVACLVRKHEQQVFLPICCLVIGMIHLPASSVHTCHALPQFAYSTMLYLLQFIVCNMCVCICACRCRHAVSAVGSYIFIYGGLKGSTLLDDFLLAEDGGGSQLSICDPRSPTWSVTSTASLCHAAVCIIARAACALVSYCCGNQIIPMISTFILTRTL